MFVQRVALYRLGGMALAGLWLLLGTILAAAQDEPPAPQFLYRSENRLILLDGYTGEATELPLEVTQDDRFDWSPDGRVLLARIKDPERYGYCLNLYDMDATAWVYDQPISCAVGEAIFSADGTRIFYTTVIGDGYNAALWLYSLTDDTRQELYRTTEGEFVFPEDIRSLEWSPTKTYLTFVSLRGVMGGTRNSFYVLNTESLDYFTVHVRNTYYAAYHPIWSEDDRWFLIRLLEEYVTSGALPRTNHRGDVYLVNAQTGEQHRLTYTPAEVELDVRWTEDGEIAFTAVIEQAMIFTLDEAMQVEEVPRDAMVMPEPVDDEDFFSPQVNVMVSPDRSLGAWVSSSRTEQGGSTYELNIGEVLPGSRTSHFSVPIPESLPWQGGLIGWRPSDEVYPQG